MKVSVLKQEDGSLRSPSVIAIGFIASLLATALSGCTTTINPDAVQRTNATLERFDQTKGPEPNSHHDQELRLWGDQPQYAALLDAVPVKRMRMISPVAPRYPLGLRLAHINGRVLVTFVVGTDGHVVAARILESSDSRFDASALEAVQGFTFIPAQGVDGPTLEMATIPFNFWWSPKAHTPGS